MKDIHAGGVHPSVEYGSYRVYEFQMEKPIVLFYH